MVADLQPFNNQFLASSKVGSPPLMNLPTPFEGDRLMVSWDLPYGKFQGQPLSIRAKVRLWDGREKIFMYSIEHRRGTYEWPIFHPLDDLEGSVIAYRIQMVNRQTGEAVAEVSHPLWNTLDLLRNE
jgi:hypothetical protein